MTSKITQPVANGRSKISPFLETASLDATFIVVSVIADQPLILNVQQAYDEDFFDSIGAAEYTDVGTETTFRFPRVGVKNFFTLSNVSGTDCTFTRAFAEFRNQTSSNIVQIPDTVTTSDELNHTKLDTLNNIIVQLNETLIDLQKQSPVYFRDRGEAYYVSSPEFNTALASAEEFVIYNPVGSGKTIYLYNVSFYSKAPPGLDYNATIRADKISAYNGGVVVPNNLKGNLNLALTNLSPAEFVTKPTSVSSVGRVFNKKLNNEADSSLVLFQSEFLEIPPGLGLSFACFGSAETVNVGINLRYFERFDQAPPEINLRSIIPDVDPEGNPIRTEAEGLNVYTWGFTTTDEAVYDLFSLTNNWVIGDEEYITTLYEASDTNQTNIIGNINLVSTGGITRNEDDNTIRFAPNILDNEIPQANITLSANTSYVFKVRTLLNDSDEGGANAADIRLAIVAQTTGAVLELEYLNVAIAMSLPI